MAAERKAMDFVLADGETKIPLRPLTYHADDAAALRLHYEAEHLANAVVTRLGDVSRAKTAKEAAEINKVAVELRTMRDAAFAAFLLEYLKGALGADAIKQKVVAQCGEDDLTFIMQTVRETPDYSARLLRSLVNDDPVGVFETLLTRLEQTDAGRTYLRTICEPLLTRLTNSTGPTPTT